MVTKVTLGNHSLTPVLVLLLAGVSTAAVAEPAPITQWTQSDMGGVGLLQMPSARMAPTGELSFNVNRTSPYTRYSLSLQPIDWFEATLRYTAISNRDYSADKNFSSQNRKDKAVDAKVRLWREGYWVPALSVGGRDLGGTGLFSGEYVVANKRFWDVDVTLGLGWGYTGGRGNLHNPFEFASDKFKQRPAPNVGKGGEFDAKAWFRGPVALFGGLEYQTPWEPLRVKLEYDGNDYRHEPLDNNQRHSSPVNVGLVYRLSPGIDLHAGLERGNTGLLGITLHGNLKTATPMPKALDPKPLDANADFAVNTPAKQPAESVDWASVSRELEANAGVQVERITQSADGKEIKVVGTQQRYFQQAQGIGRASRVLDHAVDDNVTWLTYRNQHNGLPIDAVSLNRHRFNDLLTNDITLEDISRSVEMVRDSEERSNEILLYEAAKKRFSGGIGTSLDNSIGGPESFVLYRFNLEYEGEFRLTDHAWVSGLAQFDMLDNYDKYRPDVPSKLPPVRTQVRHYMTDSRFNVQNLQLNYARYLGNDWYAMGYAGLLESMYGGVGSEVLYRPFDEPWALGANVNWVKQRRYRQHFGWRDYSVTTGHITGYLDTGFHDLQVALSAGRYLAKDWGATLDVSRQFSNGVAMGFWATKTDVSSEDFGEGSFDKGFYVTIPFDLILPKSTRSSARFVWQPLLRDGGARLNRANELYRMTSESDTRRFNDNLNYLTK